MISLENKSDNYEEENVQEFPNYQEQEFPDYEPQLHQED
jgi:hypothetical protein